MNDIANMQIKILVTDMAMWMLGGAAMVAILAGLTWVLFT